MPSARWWKDYYARELERLGERGIERMFDAAPALTIHERGAVVFPHVRLGACGTQVAAVAQAIVREGRDTVLALGVMHGARESDIATVSAARAGDETARTAMCRIHGPDHYAAEEFSLDGFSALLAAAARRAGKKAPRLVKRYPFMVFGDPGSCPGIEELIALRVAGAAVVATADHLHHGVGYGTPPDERLAIDDARALAHARSAIATAMTALAAGDKEVFLRACARERSDFRDNGPVLASLLAVSPWTSRIEELTLVDYASDLGAAEPTWVAAALMTVMPA